MECPRNLGDGKLGKLTGTADSSITKRVQEMKDRVSGKQDIIFKSIYQSKKMLNLKCSRHKT